jgi:hypothetical protein
MWRGESMVLLIRIFCVAMLCLFLGSSPLPAAIGRDAPVSSKITVSGKIIDYGIVESKEELNYEIPGSGGEKSIMIEEPKISETTTKIPMKKGSKFGYKWQITGFQSDQPVEITYRYKHPPFVGPDGKRTEGHDTPIIIQPENGKIESFDGYEFSEDYELVPGKWTLSIVCQDKVVVSKTFQVVGSKK